MLPLYDMARGFIHTVIPIVFLDVVEEYGFDDLISHWSTLLVGLLGFVVCLAIGILFIVCVPCAGCCTCCCRTCCCCRGKTHKTPSKYKRISCTVQLGVITILMFSAVICSFVALSQLRHELSPSGFLQDVVNGFEHAETFVQDTGTEINDAVVVGMRSTADDISTQLDTLAEQSIDQLVIDTGIQPSLSQLTAFVNDLPSLKGNLTQVDDAWANLNTLYVTLDIELNNSRINLAPLLTTCSGAPAVCADALADLNDLQPEADFSTPQSLATEIAAIDAAISTGLIDDMNNGMESLANASQAIDDELRTQIDSANAAMNDTVNEVTGQVETSTSAWMTFSLAQITDSVIGIMEPTDTYGGYAVAGMQALTSICLFITVFNIIALILGTIGSTGTLKHGANLLLTSSAFLFIFGWTAMLITVITFSSGGLVEGVGCRHLVQPGESIDRLLTATDGSGLVNVPSQLENVSILDALSGCKNDESIYQVLNVEENFGFDIGDVVNNMLEEVENVLEEIKGTHINVPEITVITDEIANVILVLYSQLEGISFNTYTDALADPTTKLDIPDYVSQLYNIADTIGDPNIRAKADILSSIQDTTVSDMEVERVKLDQGVTYSVNLIYANPIPDVVAQLNQSQIYFNEEANNLIGQSVNNTVDGIFSTVADFTTGLVSSIENDIGQCRSLYDAVTDLIFAPCVYLLNPYQALWFTYGWFLAFGLISLGFLFSMADMYRALAEQQKVNPIKDEHEAYVAVDGSMQSVVPPVQMEPLPPPPERK